MIDHILQKKSIVEYLEQQGHDPVKHLSGGRLSYLCPFDDHNETQPSFMVWTNSDFENFYCFGCQRKYHIVHLVSFVEHISFKEAFTKLSAGMEISTEQDQEYAINKIEKQYNEGHAYDSLSHSILAISSLCRSYLESVSFDKQECSIMDRLWQNVDTEISEFKFEELENTLEHLPTMLQYRREHFEYLKMEQKKREYKS